MSLPPEFSIPQRAAYYENLQESLPGLSKAKKIAGLWVRLDILSGKINESLSPYQINPQRKDVARVLAAECGCDYSFIFEEVETLYRFKYINAHSTLRPRQSQR